jgi:hypothetical protein
MESDNTPQACIGVVKDQFAFQTNPAQHAADMRMLENTPEFSEHLKDKEFDCICVDGVEAEFLWTEKHVTNSKTCTIVTTRHSGGVI